MKKKQKTAIITGAGGFIGSHLAADLKKRGYWIKGIDLKHPEFSKSHADEFILADLRKEQDVSDAFQEVDELYMLAANMGGVGFTHTVNADVMRDNVLINTFSLQQALEKKIKKVFYASSACIYPQEKQIETSVAALKEEDAYPANPDSAYGWEKLFTEELCFSYKKDYGLNVRVARFHNIYGPEGTYQGGKEKSPAAICRKIALAKKTDTIEVWGDGEQTRSYCYIDDCCEGIRRLMDSNFAGPLNIGSDQLVSINQLVDIVASVAGKKIKKKYILNKPQGVRGRNSDNTLINQLFHWEPSIPVEVGIKKTYEWISAQLKKQR